MNTSVDAPGMNILLVDDDVSARESIKMLLNQDRHTVTEAANGHEALQLFKSSTYDVVITDYLMPGMLGDELAEHIWEIAPGQRVIMLTAYLQKLSRAGQLADVMLCKPSSREELRDAMASPVRRNIPVQWQEDKTMSGFSTAELLRRADATTKVLVQILGQKIQN
jgi:CheY-like chemotaxis protein